MHVLILFAEQWVAVEVLFIDKQKPPLVMCHMRVWYDFKVANMDNISALIKWCALFSSPTYKQEFPYARV